MDPTPVIQRAAEFGVVAFLFVIVLIGGGVMLYRVANRLTDAATEYMRRIADAGEKTASAVERQGDLTAKLEQAAIESRLNIAGLSTKVGATTRAMRHITDALVELAPADAPPRVREYLNLARQALERAEA